CRKRPDIAVDRMGLRHAAPKQESGDAGRLDFTRNGAAGEKRLDLRGKSEYSIASGVIQRLDAVWVARQEQHALGFVPDCERKHPTQSFDHVRAMASVQIKQHLGVAMAPEHDALS